MVALLPLAFSREYNLVHYGLDRAETVAAKYQPSANGMLKEWYRLGGVIPGIRSPLGGARTKDQCNDLGTPWWVSDHYQDARTSAALDVDNRGKIIAGIAARQRLSYAAATRLYYSTAALYGWYNITTDGRPFGIEPWHLANHYTSPAGYGTTPLPSTPSTPKPKPTPKPPSIENEDPMNGCIYQFTRNAAATPAVITVDSAPRTPAVSATLPGGGSHVVKPLSAYYQDRPGQPLVLIQEGAEYVKDSPRTTAGDYKQPEGSRVERVGYAANGGKAVDCTGQSLAALIGLRGIAE